MFVTQSNLAHYLIGKGTISARSVVDGDFVAAEAGRRNRNFKVLHRDGTGYFIKQVRNADQMAIMTLQREASCYRMAQSNPHFEPLARLMPKFVDYDQRRHILIVDLVPGAENLTQYHHRLNEFPVEIGRMLGEGLGAYHSEVGRMFGGQFDSTTFPRTIPFILTVHHNTEEGLKQLSAANNQLVGIIKQYPEFQKYLDELRNEWKYDTLIHADMKWDNCLVFKNEKEELDFRIVDWELADFGDASWDVAGVFQAYLTFWIFSMPAEQAATPDQFVDHAKYKLEDMLPAIKEFWKSYVKTRGLAEQEAEELLLRCMRYNAARMVHTAFEYLYLQPKMSSNAVMVLQVSLNILKEPKQAVSQLLGL